MDSPKDIAKFDSFDDFHQATHKKLDDVSGHSDLEYSRIHDFLIEELGRIGTIEEGGLDDADFSIDRTVGDCLPIGVVVETQIPGIIEAVRAALSRVDADYSILLDLEDAGIVVFKDGRLAVCSEDLDTDDVLRPVSL